MRRLLLSLAVAAAAAYVIVFRLGETRRLWVSYDVFFYYYPNILHAVRSIGAGGAGLLWNPFQNCGHPFFANIETALVYPPNLLYLALDPQIALRCVLFFNLLIGGIGTYGLARELGVSTAAALGGALTFVLGAAAYNATLWMPTVQAPYAWMPMVMWCCERLVKTPTLRLSLVLGVLLGIALLPAHPQFVFFLCQLVGLRILWTLSSGSERRRLPRIAACLVLSFAVMALLGAVQYLPSFELVGESTRGAQLRPEEIAPAGAITLRSLASAIGTHNASAPSSLAPFTIVPGILLAAAGLVRRGLGRSASFYALATILFLALAFGHATAFGRFYFETWPANMFREPARFVIATGLPVAVLTALTLDSLLGGSWRSVAIAAVALLGMRYWLGPLATMDWGLACAVLIGGAIAATAPAGRIAAAVLVVGAIALVPVLVPHRTLVRFVTGDGELGKHRALFEDLRQRSTPQDRVYLARPPWDVAFMDKTAMLFGLRAVGDYEQLETRRYAEYFTMMMHGTALESVTQINSAKLWNPREAKWPLLDLAGARYIVVAKDLDDPAANSRLIPLAGEEGIRVYENPDALPRAYYVPEIAVVPDRWERLRRLADGTDERRRLVLVDADPPSGFRGVSGNSSTADARFVADEPERVALETVAPERGFVFLADQYFPGWSATVNGEPTPILLGNHAFRVVEVPKGPVTVEFRYRSRRVSIGALVSGLSLVVVIGTIASTYRRAS